MPATPTGRRDRREKRRPSVFWALAPVVVPFIGYFAKIRIEGGENLPDTGPYVLAPNHYTKVDPLIVAVAVWRLGRAPRFLLKDSLLSVPVVGPILRWAGKHPRDDRTWCPSRRDTTPIGSQGSGMTPGACWWCRRR